MAATWLLWLHLVGAAGWVGGQLLLGPVTGRLRKAGVPREHLRLVARAGNPVLWGSLLLAVLTGFAMLWNLDLLTAPRFGYGANLETKMTLVIVAAIAAGLHVYGGRLPEEDPKRKPFLAGGAAVALLASLGILLFAARMRGLA